MCFLILCSSIIFALKKKKLFFRFFFFKLSFYPADWNAIFSIISHAFILSSYFFINMSFKSFKNHNLADLTFMFILRLFYYIRIFILFLLMVCFCYIFRLLKSLLMYGIDFLSYCTSGMKILLTVCLSLTFRGLLLHCVDIASLTLIM